MEDNEEQEDFNPESDLEDKTKAIAENRQVIKSNQQEVTSSLKETEQQMEELQGRVRKASQTLSNSFRLLRVLGWVIPITIAAIYYVALGIFNEIGFNIQTLSGIVIITPVFLALKFILWWTNIKLTDFRGSTSNRKARPSSSESRDLEINIQSEGLAERLGRLWQSASQLVDNVGTFIPGVDEYLSGKQRVQDQRRFATSLRNALRTFGYPIGERAEWELVHFGTPEHAEADLLEHACDRLCPILGIPAEVLKLVYSDYVNNYQWQKDAWASIKAHEETVSAFTEVLLANGIVDTEYLEPSKSGYPAVISIVLSLDPFSLKDFVEKYNKYYYDYASEKETLIEAIRQYGIQLSKDTTSKIRKFVPSSFDRQLDVELSQSMVVGEDGLPEPEFIPNGEKDTPDQVAFRGDKPLEELFSKVEEVMGLPAKISRVFFYERRALTKIRIKAWARLRKDSLGMAALVDLLFGEERNILAVPGVYATDLKQAKFFVSQVIAKLDDFTLASAKTAVEATFSTLETEKKLFRFTLTSNNMQLREDLRTGFDSFLPQGETKRSIAKWISDRTKVPEDFVLLMYLDYALQVSERQELFGSLKQSRLAELASFLTKYHIVTPVGLGQISDRDEERHSENLALYLATLDDYDRKEIGVVFSKYSSLFEYAKFMVDLFKREQVFPESSSVDFALVIDNVKHFSPETLNQLQELTDLLIRKFSRDECNTDVWHQPLVLAALAFFLVRQEDYLLYRPACQRAGGVERATMILYQYSRVHDDDLQRGKIPLTTFGEIALKTIDGSYRSYDLLAGFQGELASGRFYQRLSDMTFAKLQRMETHLNSIAGEATARRAMVLVKRSLKRLLETKLKAKLIEDSLRMQLVSAYLLTNPSEADVITNLLKNFLPDACKDLIASDSDYEKLLIISSEKVGQAVRLGLVPYKMPFDRFTRLFEHAFWVAVDKYLSLPGHKYQRSDFGANVVRVFPSAAYFRQIQATVTPHETLGTPEAPEKTEVEQSTGLMERIGKLMQEKYDPLQNFAVVSSLENVSKDTLAMSNLMIFALDELTNINEIAEKELEPIHMTSTLKQFFQNGEFDERLADHLQCKGVSGLSSFAFQSSGLDDEKLAETSGKFGEAVASVIKKSGALVEPEITHKISEVVFESLYEIGLVLDRLNSDFVSTVKS